MIIHFNKITDEEMKKYLEEQQKMENISTNMLNIFGGSIAKVEYLKDKQEEYNNVDNMLEQIDKIDFIEFLKKSKILYKTKEEIVDILDYINVVLLNKAKQNYKYANCINIVEDTKKHLKQNANYDMSIDNMVFNMWEEIN